MATMVKIKTEGFDGNKREVLFVATKTYKNSQGDTIVEVEH